jgi:predicted MFS family arabinose efflux permease
MASSADFASDRRSLSSLEIAPPPPPPPLSSPINFSQDPKEKHTYMVSIFCIVAALLYADQNLMAPNLTAIAQDFGFNDDERDKYLGGYIAAAFYMVGAPAALLFGYLSDTVNRRNLLFYAVILGEGPCILTYFVTKYWQLLVLRLMTGISLGGTLPLVFSLLGDMFDEKKRASVAALVQVATGVGLAVGQGTAGFVGPPLGWRWPFVIVAVPAVLAATLMMFTTEEPPRGVTEAAVKKQLKETHDYVYSERITWAKVGKLIRIPTNVLLILQGVFGCLPWGMLLTFMNDYLAQNKGLSVGTATLIMLVFGLGGAAGVIGGGLIGQHLYNHVSKFSMSVFIGVTTAIATLPLLFLINADVQSMVPLAFVSALLAGFLGSTVGPNMRAMMLNVNEPETRGVALALQTMLDDLGKGLGPALVAAIITNVGRTVAFNISALGWIPCGALLFGTAYTISKDEDAMQGRLKMSISRHMNSRVSLGNDDDDGYDDIDMDDEAALEAMPLYSSNHQEKNGFSDYHSEEKNDGDTFTLQ